MRHLLIGYKPKCRKNIHGFSYTSLTLSLTDNRLNGGFLLYRQLAAIITASGANGVIHMPFSAIRAYSQCGSYCYIMCSSLCSSGF